MTVSPSCHCRWCASKNRAWEWEDQTPWSFVGLIAGAFAVLTAWVGFACAQPTSPEPTVVPQTVAEPIVVEDP